MDLSDNEDDDDANADDNDQEMWVRKVERWGENIYDDNIVCCVPPLILKVFYNGQWWLVIFSPLCDCDGNIGHPLILKVYNQWSMRIVKTGFSPLCDYNQNNQWWLSHLAFLQ